MIKLTIILSIILSTLNTFSWAAGYENLFRGSLMRTLLNRRPFYENQIN